MDGSRVVAASDWPYGERWFQLTYPDLLPEQADLVLVATPRGDGETFEIGFTTGRRATIPLDATPSVTLEDAAWSRPHGIASAEVSVVPADDPEALSYIRFEAPFQRESFLLAEVLEGAPWSWSGPDDPPESVCLDVVQVDGADNEQVVTACAAPAIRGCATTKPGIGAALLLVLLVTPIRRRGRVPGFEARPPAIVPAEA